MTDAAEDGFFPHHAFVTPDDSALDHRRRATFRIASAGRVVIDRLVATDAPLEDLEQIAEGVEALAARLDSYQHGRRYDGAGEASTTGGGPPQGHTDYSPVIGRANPIAPPLLLRAHPDRVEGTAVFGSAFEGPPGHVHGGVVAAAFDELLGAAQALSGTPGMTGTLNVVYRRPTPLDTEIRFVGELDRVEGRKIFTVGRSYAGDELLGESTGLFIAVDFSRLAEMRRDQQADR